MTKAFLNPEPQARQEPSKIVSDAAGSSTGLGDAENAAGASTALEDADGAARRGSKRETAVGAATEAVVAKTKRNEAEEERSEVKWLLTEKASSTKRRCRCKGNCHGNCPARKGKACPNKRADDMAYCSSCICRFAGCTLAAMRLYGDFGFPENRGYCQGHFPRRPANKRRRKFLG